jgi:hypothetical protein
MSKIHLRICRSFTLHRHDSYAIYTLLTTVTLHFSSGCYGYDQVDLSSTIDVIVRQ